MGSGRFSAAKAVKIGEGRVLYCDFHFFYSRLFQKIPPSMRILGFLYFQVKEVSWWRFKPVRDSARLLCCRVGLPRSDGEKVRLFFNKIFELDFVNQRLKNEITKYSPKRYVPRSLSGRMYALSECLNRHNILYICIHMNTF